LSSSSTTDRLLIKQRPAQQHSLQGAVPGSLNQVGLGRRSSLGQ
jgi:hypothetical protein